MEKYQLDFDGQTALRHEFPYEKDISALLLRSLPPEQKRVPPALRTLADTFHKYGYRSFATFTGKLTDSIDWPITDCMIPFSLYAKEGLALLMTYELSEIIRTLRHQGLSNGAGMLTEETILPLAFGAAGAAVLFGATFGFNYLRTPVNEKMGIKPVDFDLGGEIQFVIDEINKRQEAPELGFDEIAREAYKSVTQILGKADGYETSTGQKVKRSRFSNQIIRATGAAGMINPFFQEVLMTSLYYNEFIAHEFAHAKGIPQEALAQLVGVVAQINSDNPYMQYLGYRSWLSMLLSVENRPATTPMTGDQFLEYETNRLRNLGLNPRTCQELAVRTLFLHQEMARPPALYEALNKLDVWITQQLPPGARETLTQFNRKMNNVLPRSLRTRNPSLAMDTAFRNSFLKRTGQGNVREGYVMKPLKLLHDYRGKNFQ